MRILSSIQHSLFQLAVALDQLINTLCGGWADETFSARCYRNRSCPGWQAAHRILDCLFFWHVQHCRTAYESELQRAHLPPSLRGDAHE